MPFSIPNDIKREYPGPREITGVAHNALPGDATIRINAFDGMVKSGSHNRIDIEVRQGTKVIFPKGQLYCGLPRSKNLRGNDAKELVLSLLSIECGDADDTEEQKEWSRKYSEHISCIRQQRYCDKNGNVR